MIHEALKENRTNLSEQESKDFLRNYELPLPRFRLVKHRSDLPEIISEIGFPCVMKCCGGHILHKTEYGLVKKGISNLDEAFSSFDVLNAKIAGINNVGILVEEMIQSPRELMAGLMRDEQFGPCLMFGLGGIFTEVLKDTVFRVAPLSKEDAHSMLEQIRGKKILQDIRGLPATNLDKLSDLLIKLGEIGLEEKRIKEIDLNPILLDGSAPVIADALVVLASDASVSAT